MSNQSSGFFLKVKSQDTPTSTRQATAGSLSFKVADRSATKKVNSTAPGDSGSSTKDLQKQNAGGKKPVARAKFPFEKGYSQMDWLKLTHTHPDLAGAC